MSKTFTYVLIVIAAYVAIIAGKTYTAKKTGGGGSANEGSGAGRRVVNDTGAGLADNEDENGITTGAKGRLQYQYGAGIGSSSTK